MSSSNTKVIQLYVPLAALAATAVSLLSATPTHVHAQAVGCSAPNPAACQQATAAPLVPGERETYKRLQEMFDAAGREVTRGPTGLRPGGYFRHHEHIDFYWSPNTNAHVLYGSIREKWHALGFENYGYPITDELGSEDGRARFNDFEWGTIYWTPQTGAHELHGAIRDAWLYNESGEDSSITVGGKPISNGRAPLGYPLSDETATSDGVGRFNDFEYGSIYWSPLSGAVTVRGNIRDRWRADGAEAIGYPVEEASTNGPFWCGNNLSQPFRKSDGTGGIYCERPGYIEFRTWEETANSPKPTGGLPGVIGPSPSEPSQPAEPEPQPPTTAPDGPVDMPSPDGTSGAWLCTAAGVPPDMVAAQTNPYGCPSVQGGVGGSMWVTTPQHDQWVCAFGMNVTKTFVVDRTEGPSPLCGNGIRYHLVKIQ